MGQLSGGGSSWHESHSERGPSGQLLTQVPQQSSRLGWTPLLEDSVLLQASSGLIPSSWSSKKKRLVGHLFHPLGISGLVWAGLPCCLIMVLINISLCSCWLGCPSPSQRKHSLVFVGVIISETDEPYSKEINPPSY